MRYEKCWGGALWCCLALTCIGSKVFFFGQYIQLTMVASSLSLSLLYGFCKYGCFLFNCCGWPVPISSLQNVSHVVKRRWPLQIIEAVASFCFGLILIVLLFFNVSYWLVIALFFLSHGALRCFSVANRNPDISPMQVLFRVDSGLVLLAASWPLAFAGWGYVMGLSL